MHKGCYEREVLTMDKKEFMNIRTGDIVYPPEGDKLCDCAFEVCEIYNKEIKGFIIEDYTLSYEGVFGLTVTESYKQGFEKTMSYTKWRTKSSREKLLKFYEMIRRA